MDMVKLGLKRGAIIVLMLGGAAALSVRRDTAADTVSKLADRSRWLHLEAAAASISNSTSPNGTSAGPHHFSMAYDYCYVDAEGRPMIFHRRRLVFFLPESPPEVNDRTFIETNECH
jgi:hypothetical protein